MRLDHSLTCCGCVIKELSRAIVARSAAKLRGSRRVERGKPNIAGYSPAVAPSEPWWVKQDVLGRSAFALRASARQAPAPSLTRGPVAPKLAGASEGGTPDTKFPGGHRSRVTPVPIPNTEVKLATADGTACVGAWESRSLPGLFSPSPRLERASGFFIW